MRKLLGNMMPSTWEGWFLLFVFVAAAAVNFLKADQRSPSRVDTFKDVLPETLAFALLVVVIVWLTRERKTK